MLAVFVHRSQGNKNIIKYMMREKNNKTSDSTSSKRKELEITEQAASTFVLCDAIVPAGVRLQAEWVFFLFAARSPVPSL